MSLFFVKFISSLLLPLPIALIVLLVALVVKRWRVLLSLFSACLLIACSLSITADMLTGNLETSYMPLVSLPEGIHTIVVLGAGARNDPNQPANTQLNAASLARLVEGVRLYRSNSNKKAPLKLVLSGGRVFQSPDETGPLNNTADVLGVDPADVLIENGSRNTKEEAKHLKGLLSNQAFVLVTSATHMKRALYLFEQEGMHPVPAPTQFLTRKHSKKSLLYWIPRSSNLVHTDIALHEYLGLLWARV